MNSMLSSFESDEEDHEELDLSEDIDLYTIKVPRKHGSTSVVVSGMEDRYVDNRYLLRRSGKRNRKQRVEVVRVDIRNTFALMMTNMFNTLDFNQISSVYRALSMPNASYIMDRTTKLDSFSVEFDSPFKMAIAVYSNIGIFPDCVTTLLASNFDAATGIITYSLQFNMTKVYTHRTVLHLPKLSSDEGTSQTDANQPKNLSERDPIESISDSMSEMTIVEKVSEMQESLPRREPCEMIVQCKVILRTNEQKRISEGKATLTMIKY